MSPQDRADVRDGVTQLFDVVIRGYDRAQVHELLDRLSRELGVLQADRDASAGREEKLNEQLSDAKMETDALRRSASAAGESDFQSMGPRISNMLKLAEEEAADIRRVAVEEQTRSRTELESTTETCARMRTAALKEAERVARAAQDNARRVLEEAQNRGASLVADAQKRADEMTLHSQETINQAEAKSKSRMAKVAEDFDLSLQSRKAEAARIEQERDQASRHDVRTRIERAQAEAEDLIVAAEKRVADLEAQRVEVHSWLTQLRRALATVPAADLTSEVSSIPANSLSAAAGRHGRSGATTIDAPALFGSAGADPDQDRRRDEEPDAPPNIAEPTQPRGSGPSRAIPAGHASPEPDGAKLDGTALAREDILEYRQMRRKMR